MPCPNTGRPDYIHSTCCYYCGDEVCRGEQIPCIGATSVKVSEKTLEKLVNWNEMNVRAYKLTEKGEATPVPTEDVSSNVGLPDGLPDEFTDNNDPKGDACCYQGCRGDA